jgi:hypothetical protein
VAATGLNDDVGGAFKVQEELLKISGPHCAKLESETYPVTPDSLSSPCPKCESSIPGESPHGRFPHGLPEARVRQQVCRVGNLEPQQVCLEPVRCGCVLLHAVCDQVARVYDVLLPGLEGDLVDLTFATQGEQATAGGVSVTPVGDALDLLARSIAHSIQILSPCLC